MSFEEALNIKRERQGYWTPEQVGGTHFDSVHISTALAEVVLRKANQALKLLQRPLDRSKRQAIRTDESWQKVGRSEVQYQGLQDFQSQFTGELSVVPSLWTFQPCCGPLVRRRRIHPNMDG